MRRQFLDEVKAQVPIHPIAETTAEMIARVGGEQSSKGITGAARQFNWPMGTTRRRTFSNTACLVALAAVPKHSWWFSARVGK
jgi:hypothetical protein